MVRTTYNQIAQTYTDRYGQSPFFKKHIDRFSGMVPKGGKILDLGCGSGRGSKPLFDRGFFVIGIDFSDTMLQLARNRAPAVSFQKMDMRKLKFADESFDGIWSSFSLIHIPKKDVKKVLKECKRVLKPGGIMFISTSLGEGKEGLQEEWLNNKLQMFFHSPSKKILSNDLMSVGFSLKKVGRVMDEAENDDQPIIFVYAKK